MNSIGKRKRPFGPIPLIVAVLAVGLAGSCVGPPLDIQPEELPLGVSGTTYSAQLQSDAASNSTTWELTQGQLPPGLRLIADQGRIAGVPNEPGDFQFTIRGQENANVQRLGERQYSLRVIPRLIITADLPAGRVGVAFDYAPSIVGGTAPYTVTIIGLPAGLDYDPTSGRITGIPVVEADRLILEFSATDTGSTQQSASTRANWEIQPPGVSIPEQTLAAGRIATAYTQTVTIAGGVAPYRFSVVSGLLPDGLRLNQSTGVISGTPTTAQLAAFTVKVSDESSPASSATRDFTIDIQP